MFLAPLNYDRFFKKVFSDLEISKRFLEDFLDISIEGIELLPTKAKITDSATAVEFDFRCHINGQYVVIDMQQWFKVDVVKRFYLYHTLGTALQAEVLPIKQLTRRFLDRSRRERDYNKLAPTITLIWMANDNLNFKGDYVSFSMLPEALSEFMRLERLWEAENREELLAMRRDLLMVMDNRTRQLDFLPKNRLIYAFQGNIVGNNDERLRKYYAWFEFAEKTRDKNNKAEDFEQYRKDPIFAKIIKRIAVQDLPVEDLDYVDRYEQWQEEFLRYDMGIREEARLEGHAEGHAEGRAEGEKKGEAQGEKKQAYKTAERCLLRGMSIEETSEISGLPPEEVKAIANALNITPPEQ